jgi:hypothetical protein
MSEKEIDPSKVTKPIQLLAAWLVGLIVINGSFLGAASQIHEPTWIPALLVIAAVVNVPVFILSLFLLQTKFRPEMQEDAYYSKYLEHRYSSKTGKTELIKISSDEQKRALDETLIKNIRFIPKQPMIDRINPRDISIEVNDLLPKFKEIVNELHSVGLHPSKTFGSTSKKPVPPHPFIVSIGSFVDIETIQKVVKIASKFGLEGVAYADDEISNYQIYIGAYSYDDPLNDYLPISKEVLDKILTHDFTLEQFLELVPQ